MTGSPGIEQGTEWSSVMNPETSTQQPQGHKWATQLTLKPNHTSFNTQVLHTLAISTNFQHLDERPSHPNYLIRNLFGGAAGSVISIKMGVTFETHLLPCGTANHVSDIEASPQLSPLCADLVLCMCVIDFF